LRLAGLQRGLVFADLAGVVAGSGVAGLAGSGGVDGGVEWAVAGDVEPVALVVTAGCLQRSGSGVAGEVVGGRESGDVTDTQHDSRYPTTTHSHGDDHPATAETSTAAQLTAHDSRQMSRVRLS